MIVYLDTSSLVKLYVEEDASSQIHILLQSSKVAATSLIAYAEARSTFARRFREDAFLSDEYNHLKETFEKDWNSYLIMNVTQDVIREAGNLAEKHALRGFDSIHLASALTLRRELSTPIVFSCFDERLTTASKRENLQ